MELISRDDAVKMIRGWFDIINLNPDILVDSINSLPTIEERKEGHWISHGDDQCSECGMSFPDLYPLYNSAKYCPNCGAIMKGERK